MSENGEKKQLPRSMLLPDSQVFGRSVASMLKTPGNGVTRVGMPQKGTLRHSIQTDAGKWCRRSGVTIGRETLRLKRTRNSSDRGCADI